MAVAAAAVLVVVALATRGGGEEAADGLRVERAPNGAEVVVYLENREANVPATAGGATSVMVECLDRAGEVLLSAAAGLALRRHGRGIARSARAHAAGSGPAGAASSRCRVKGADPALEGGVL